MNTNTNNLLTPKKQTNFEVLVRVAIFYVVNVTLLIFTQIVTTNILVSIFPPDNSANRIVVINIIRGVSGIVGIIITFIFLQNEKKSLTWTGLDWDNKRASSIFFLGGVLIGLIAVLPTFIIEFLVDIIDISAIQLLSLPALLITSFFTILGIGIGEEIIYRGYIHKVIEKQTENFWLATIISATTFGLLHFIIGIFQRDIFYMTTWGIVSVIFGISMSLVYRETNYNLMMPIAIHAIWDIFYFALQIETFSYEANKLIFAVFAQIIGSLVIVILGIGIYRQYIVDKLENKVIT
jgi:membrane protease YdiL (CAAX protease family)